MQDFARFDGYAMMFMKVCLTVLLGTLTFLSNLPAATIFDRGSAGWRWRPGTNEASTPIEAWRTLAFSDTQFTTSPAPYYYGETFTGGTLINGMQNVYGSIFLRHTFNISDSSQVAGLRLGAQVDDGFVAWINWTEVQR